MDSLSELGPLIQLAYVVPDVIEAAQRHHRLFGSGPYFASKDAAGAVIYRGKEVVVNFDVAIGQWRDLQIEFIKPIGDEPSFLREVMPVGSSAAELYKIKYYLADFEPCLEELKARGGIAVEVKRPGAWGALIDTLSEFGHFIEIAQVTPEMTMFDERIREAMAGFDGSDPIRPIDSLFEGAPEFGGRDN